MTIARSTYLFVAVLLVFLAAWSPTGLRAQDGYGGGLTCGWCVQDPTEMIGLPGVIIILEWEHAFLEGGNECGWEGHDHPGAQCSRCGRTSECHTDPEWGDCHIPCGPDGDAVAALVEVEGALSNGDVTAVASALLAPRTGFSFEFRPEAGRIDLVLACDKNRVFRTIPVLPAARERLTALFRLSERTE